MNKYAVVAGIIAGAFACISAPAVAHGGAGWSVTIESQPQPYYYTPPPPVFYPQSPYVYGPPPSAFQPAPPTYQYRQQDESWQGQQHRHDRGHRDDGRRDNEWRGRDHDRGRDGQNTQRWEQGGNRPGERHDLPRWGYGGQRR